MDSYEKFQNQIFERIQDITVSSFKNITSIWKQCYDQKSCEMFLKKLSEHVSEFYQEVIDGSNERRKSLLADIKKLNEEAADLRKRYQVSFTLPPEDGVPLATIKGNLTRKLQKTLEEIKKRKQQVDKLLLQQKALCKELDDPCLALPDAALQTVKGIEELRGHIKALKSEQTIRMTEISNLRQEIRKLLRKLEIEITDKEEDSLVYGRSIAPTRANIYNLEKLRDVYREQAEEVRRSIDTMKKRLEILWDCLETSPWVRDKFSITEYSQTTHDLLYQELDRCEEEKRQNIDKYVAKLQQNLIIWREKTLTTESKLKQSISSSNYFDEGIINMYEEELGSLKKFYYDNEKMFTLISTRKDLRNRMTALESKQSDPNRFENRGAQLLKQDKERKSLAKNILKVDNEITDLVHNYEKQRRRKFLVYGKDIMDEISSESNDMKERLGSARKKSPTASHSPGSRVTSSPNTQPVSYFLSLNTRNNNIAHSTPGAIHPQRNLMDELSKERFKRQSRNKVQNECFNKSRVIATTMRGESARCSMIGRTRRKAGKTFKVPSIVVTQTDSPSENNIEYPVHLE